MEPKVKVPKSIIKGRLAIACKDLMLKYPRTPYSDIPGKLRELYGFDGHLPSYKTFERFLKAANFKIVKLKKKPFISRINMEKRINFAKKYVKKPIGFWKKIIWSDETVVRSQPKGIDVFVKTNSREWREKMGQNYQIQNGGFGVMFWGYSV